MIRRKAIAVSQDLEALWASGTLTGKSDAELLNRFVAVKDGTAEAAFRELMRRHGPMVIGVCRQILGQPQDADDAFQSTFLVLVRRARSIRVADSLAPWLYMVAYRTAQRARAVAARYRSAPVENLEDSMGSPTSGSCQIDLRPLLHEELNRLPAKYRDPIVLCHLEGKTHEEAARLLRWPVGTVSGRLSRGRDLLRSRLERRGLEVAPSVLAAPWLASTDTAIALPLVESTVGAAIGAAGTAIPASVLALTQGVLNNMLLHKIKISALCVLVVGGATTGVGMIGIHASHTTSKSGQSQRPDANKELSTKAAVLGTTDPLAKPDVKALPRAYEGRSIGLGPEIPQARLKNFPNVEQHRAVAIRTSSMVIVQSPDRSALQAMSLELDHPRWDKFQFPPGTTAWPTAGPDVAALMIKGKTIDRIAAFSPFRGTWVGQTLLNPIEDELNPLIGPGFALYQAGNDFYAFSAVKGTWSVLHLERNESAVVTTSAEDIEVLQGNRFYVFAVKQGEWSKPVEAYVPPSPASKMPEKPQEGRKFER
jgi:RNA polymerase sigma factor (sigma-70 family)